MARQSFFSFRYKKDNWRASIVRNSWVTQDREAAGFFDSADWEEVKKKSDSAIETWIDGQLKGTSVTVVLIGADTAGKKWINYEITASHKKGNGILGIYIHNIKDKDSKTTTKGRNPFDDWSFTKNGVVVTYPVYDWVADDGYKNMGDWIEKAAKAAGK
ncbi:TIR-like domain-containing protein [Aeromonas veronii]|uniref:TIR domain-containing protein n=1 Tax=Aeromonas veronii TaxID=654 RepID=UPI0007189AF4|nr:TIR domain-containing protein [Aeromonas veronii]KRV68068.1 TIR-like domain-containing protein [Aeromonas veronii]KRV77532.1 TIR-like domain-containing protein [Aeromonas veronii]KRV84530.1 TIR-like domain-containing protein [Aeromonas veronii]KRV84812.1 TIR-like domain-containing protein [Aeromonas veronii]